ncbi:CASP-like protein 1 [Apium graveolens]|uniref:CASP-like protein 1 n=1 Tax=Apium graveolens TaxID=4045 RepID=UPI003D78D802
MASINPESVIRELEHNKSWHGTHNIIKYSMVIDLLLRVNLFVNTLAPVLLLATSKQTVFFTTSPSPPFGAASLSAYFTDAPALIFAISGFSLACLYSIITALLSFLDLRKQAARSINLMFTIFVMDLLLFGIVAAVAGAAGDVSYIGLKGNKHARWQKICNEYDTYCLHVGFAVLFIGSAAVTLLFLIILCIFTLLPRVR